MTRDELAWRLYEAHQGRDTWKEADGIDRDRFRRLADDTIARLYAEHYAPVERKLDEIDGGFTATIAERVNNVGARLTSLRRTNAALQKLLDVDRNRPRPEPPQQALLDEVRSALNELDGGVQGTLADRVRAIPGLVRARALRATVGATPSDRINRLEALVLCIERRVFDWNASIAQPLIDAIRADRLPFRECAACASKPGTPTLCAECLARRREACK